MTIPEYHLADINDAITEYELSLSPSDLRALLTGLIDLAVDRLDHLDGSPRVSRYLP